MRPVNLQQNTPEWEAWRKGKIGGSTAPIIMGTSPWATPFALWGDMTGVRPIDRAQNEYVKAKGHKYEPRARALYELKNDVDMPAACGEHEKYPFLIVSLDGRNPVLGKGLEIKYLGKEDFKLTKQGGVPPKYVPQLHHQHMVGDLDAVDFVGYNDEVDDIAVVTVKRDRQYEKLLLDRELRFYEQVQRQDPPELTDRDRKELKSKEHVQFFRQLLKANEAVAKAEAKLTESRAAVTLAEAQKRLQELKAMAESLADEHPLVECMGVKITKFYTRGTVEWAKIPLPPGIDPERYRKDGRFSTRITFPKS